MDIANTIDVEATLTQAKAARAEYERLVDLRDAAISSAVWWRIAGDLHTACAGLLRIMVHSAMPSGRVLTRDMVQVIKDRATDAEHRAQYAARMTAVAAASNRVIDVEVAS